MWLLNPDHAYHQPEAQHLQPGRGYGSKPNTPSVRIGATRFDEFRPSTLVLELPPGRREQSRFSAYAASAAPQRERVGAFEIGTGESFAVRHSRGRSVSLIPCSSVQASVDIGP